MKSRLLLLGMILVVQALIVGNAWAQGPPDSLYIKPSNTAVTAGASVQFTITVVDSDGVRTPVLKERTITFFAGEFALPPNGSSQMDAEASMRFSDIVTIPAGQDSATVLYSENNTNGGVPYQLTVFTSDGLEKSLQGRDSVTVLPAELGSFVWNGVDGEATAGIAEIIALEARDIYGNLKFDYADSVYLSTTSGATDEVVQWGKSGGSGTLENITDTDSAVYVFSALDNGIANLNVTNEKMETFRLEAVKGSASGTSPVIVVNHAPAAALIEVSGNSQEAVVQTTVALPLVVRVEDEFGNPVDGETVTFGERSGNGVVDIVIGGGVDSVGVSDPSGEVECQYWLLGDDVDVINTARAYLTGGTPFVDFTATGLPGPGDSIVLTPASQNVTIGSYTVVTAVLRDAYGNAVPDEQVTILIADPSFGTLVSNPADSDSTSAINSTTRYGTTDTNGEITVRHHASQTAGLVDVVDALSGTVPPGDVTDAVYTTITTGSATNLRLVWTADSTTTAGTPISFTIQAVDGIGNLYTSDASTVDLTREVDSELEFSLTSGGPPVTQVTLQSGERLVWVRGTKAGMWDITASDNAGSLTSVADEVTIEDTGTIDHYVLATLPADSIVAGENFNVTVEAQDVYNNRVMGAGNSINLTAVYPDGVTVTSDALLVTNTSLVAGQANVLEQYERAEDIRVRVDDGSNEGVSNVLKVTAAAADRLEKVSGDSTGVDVGGSVPLAVRVFDKFNNPVADELVSFSEQTPGCVVTPNSDSSDGNGLVTVFLQTALTVGSNRVEATIYDGSLSRWSVDFEVSTVAGGIAYYTVTPTPDSETAGVPIDIEVQAFDGNDNPVPDTGTPVTLSLLPPGGGSFGQNPVTLTGGTATTTLTHLVSGGVQVQASDGSASGTSPTITILPGLPDGLITALAAPDTITANGSSTSLITSGTITDPYGNTVAQGTKVTVATTLGSIISIDQDGSTPGNQQLTNASGVVSLRLQSSSSTGAADVSMTSVQGAASGSVQVEFAGPPLINCQTDPVPNNVVPGDFVEFEVFVTNTSTTTGLTLSTATKFEFSDNGESFSAALQAPIHIPPAPAPGVTLRFVNTQVDPLMDPDNYQPALILRGTDLLGSPFAETCLLLSNSLVVSAIEITSIAAPAVVIKNKTDTVTVRVTNLGPVNADINTVDLIIPTGSYNFTPSSPDLPVTIGQGEYADIRKILSVRNSSEPGFSTIDASVTADVNGVTVTDGSLAPYLPLPEWEIKSGATLEYVTGSLIPMIASRGQTHGFVAQLHNSGDETVTLETATTLSFNDGALTYQSPLSTSTAIAGGATREIQFDDAQINPAFSIGLTDVSIYAEGEENGALYQQTLMTSDGGNLLEIVAPAAINPTLNPLSPDTVSQNTNAFFEVTFENSGGADIILDTDSTIFSFGPGASDARLDAKDAMAFAYSAPLDPAGETVIGGAGTTTLKFVTQQVTASPQTYFPEVRIVGTENGIPFKDTYTLTAPLFVQQAPVISIDGIAPSQLRITADQGSGFTLVMDVSNSGDATVNFDDVEVRFILGGGDKSGEFVITVPGAFDGGSSLPGQSTDTITFPISDNTANLMSTGNMTIEGTLWVTDPNGPTQIIANTDFGGKGSLLVESEAVLVTHSILPSQDPVTAGQGNFAIRMLIENTGESAVSVALNQDSTFLDFTAPDDWVWTIEAELGGGGRTLGGGETDTVIFNVQAAGMTAGPRDIYGTLQVIENNSGRLIVDTSGTGSILVQSAGQITITGVTTSQPSVTEGSMQDWNIFIDLWNGGEADVELTLPDSLLITIQTATGAVLNPVFSLDGGGAVLEGNSSGRLTVIVDETGTYGSYGNKNINVRLAGVDANSGDPVAATGAGSVRVQSPPNVLYTPGTLDPTVVSSGSVVSFSLQLINGAPDGATVHFNRALTRLRFGTAPNDFEAALSPTSPDSLAGAGFNTFVFTATEIDPAIGTGARDVDLDLWWEANGETGSDPITLPSALNIQDAPRLNIVSIRASQLTVTSNQDSAWHVTMILQNNGEAGVDLNLSDTATYLTLKTLGDLDVTSQFVFDPPSGLAGSGGKILPGNQAQDSLIFNVLTTGTTEELIIISGNVAGKDVFSPDSVFDDTADGGFGTVTVQSPADLEILSIIPDQQTATANQGEPFKIRAAVRNNGGSAARIVLDADTTSLTFAEPAGWLWDVDPALTGLGDILAGYEVDTVLFNIQQVGSFIGDVRIDGLVRGFETNTGRPLADSTTDDAGWGSIEVQSPAIFVIDSVTTSRSTITQGSDVDWTIRAYVSNPGGADLSLILPDSVSVIIDGSGGPTIQEPFELVGGGTTLQKGGTGELVFTVTNTGPFALFGERNIDVRIVAEEENSGSLIDATGTGSIIVQTEPDPVYVAGTLSPSGGTSGEKSQYQIKIANLDPDAATIVLRPLQTKLHFASGAYEAFLAPSSPVTIPGGDTLAVIFEQTDIDTFIALGKYAVFVDLFWDQNDSPGFKPIVLDPDSITVQPGSELEIVEIIAQQGEVTENQARSWNVWMSVRNKGAASIEINRLSPETKLIFRLLGSGTDISDEYTVNPPTWLTPNPGDILSQDEEAILVFEVDTTGSTTGTILISGNVVGKDINTNYPVADDGGSESILVQTEGDLAFDGLTTSQPTVTEAQTSPWYAQLALRNAGESDLFLTLDSCRVMFGGGADGWSYVRPPTLQGGGNVLEGNSSDVLIFEVDITAAAGTWDIDAFVEAVEINSSRPEIDSTGTSGFGSILVQTQPSLQLTSTTITAPRAPEVNTSQPFGIEVRITNSGQAQAESVYFHITNTGDTPEPPLWHTAAKIDGSGATKLDTFLVTAPALIGTDTFSVVIDSAIDANSLQTDLITILPPAQPADSFDVAFIQKPAALEIVSVIPSRDQITRNQSTPWTITVAVRDSGEADLRFLQPALPTRDDISFFIGGEEQFDYIVDLPTSLVKFPDWTVPGDSTDALIFTVTSSGGKPGVLDIYVNLTANDLNDPGAEDLTAQGQTVVTVEEASGLFIESTDAMVWNKQPSPPLAFVNRYQEYTVDVIVTNTGEDVDSVKVLLTTDGASDIDTTDVLGQYQAIAADSSRTFTFDVVAGPTSNPYETFTAVIDSAKSENTGQQIDPAAPIDYREFIATQDPANLDIDLAITSPDGAVDGTVSTLQEFEVTATVANLGQAATDSSGNVRLITDFELHPSTPAVRPYYAGEQITWRLIAPGDPAVGLPIVSAIVDTLLDKNINAPALINQDTVTVLVNVEAAGKLENPNIQIVQPEGARDRMLSTGQEFTVQVEILTTLQTQGILASIELPIGFESIGSEQKNLGDGADGVKTTTFRIQAPAVDTAAPEQIQVTFTAKDENTGLDLDAAVGSISVEVEPKTNLRLTAGISGPPEATDGTVSIGSNFTVEATVQNLGTADISTLSSDPAPVLRLDTPTGYVLNSDPARKRFAVGTPVTWTVTAPSTASGPLGISVVIDTIPDDGNSNEQAAVDISEVTIPVQTEGAVVQVADVTDELGFDTKVVPAGATGIELFAIEMKNPKNNPEEPPVRIESIDISVLDGNNRLLSNPGGTLADLTLEINGEQVVVSQPAVNPVTLNLASVGSASNIESSDSTNLAFSVSLRSSPAANEIRLAIQNSDDIIVRDSASSQQLDVVYKSNGQPIDDGILSHPLVILSNNFSEYAHNYPNPFQAGSGTTKIAYFLSSQSDVTIKIYSLAGNLVYEKVYNRGDPHTQPGPREAEWDGRNMKGDTVRNGIYICKIVAGSNSATFRIAVAK